MSGVFSNLRDTRTLHLRVSCPCACAIFISRGAKSFVFNHLGRVSDLAQLVGFLAQFDNSFIFNEFAADFRFFVAFSQFEMGDLTQFHFETAFVFNDLRFGGRIALVGSPVSPARLIAPIGSLIASRHLLGMARSPLGA